MNEVCSNSCPHNQVAGILKKCDNSMYCPKKMDPAHYDGVDRLKSGDQLITEERDRQVHELGYVIARDLGINNNEELERMAIVLLRPGIANLVPDMIPAHWNKATVKRMLNKPMQQRRVIAGALIAAQIDVDNLKYQILTNEDKFKTK